jgi:hypothetical protein
LEGLIHPPGEDEAEEIDFPRMVPVEDSIL